MQSRETQRGDDVVEVHIQGRNDDYEPQWAEKLEAAISYNRRQAELAGVDLRFAFTEWNPPADRPLLSPGLVQRHPYVRAIVVSSEVHDRLSLRPEMKIVPPFATNAALRSSTAKYFLITGGDVFFGREVLKRMAAELRPRHLYRAERVNIRSDIQFGDVGLRVIEDPANIVSIDTCTIPPYDEAPYTNASGDFILADRATFVAIRGVDEAIRRARLHLDSRCVITFHRLGLPTILLGQIFHISHLLSLTNIGPERYRGDPSYDYLADLPYLNSDDWGLRWANWKRTEDRLWFVGLAHGTGQAPFASEPLEDKDNSWVDEVRNKLYAMCVAGTRTWPGPPDEEVGSTFGLLTTHAHWAGASVNGATIQTPVSRWAYSAEIPISLRTLESSFYYWIRVTMRVSKGSVGVGFLEGDDLIGEFWATCAEDPVSFHLGVSRPNDIRSILFRNVNDEGASIAEILDVALVRKSVGAVLDRPEAFSRLR